MPPPEVESLMEVWEVTAWKDCAVYKTRNTGETRWVTEAERRANHPRKTNLIFSPMPQSYTEPTVRTRKS